MKIVSSNTPALLSGLALATGQAAAAQVSVSLPAATAPFQEQILNDAYIYLLGRAIVVRQEQADKAESGFAYNRLKYNPVGQPIGWVNPNLDVANTEAWIAVDRDTPAILTVPRIDGRYYTVQILDEWGEVITNINERNYPLHPSGRFALVAPGSSTELPEDTVRIELRSYKAKLLARVEIKGDAAGAEKLQTQISLQSMGNPTIASPPPLPKFANDKLIGVELFDYAEALLASVPDVSPKAAQLQSQVRDIARQARNPANRAEMDRLLTQKIAPAFVRYSVSDAGTVKNNWVATTTIGNYGEAYAIRSAANLVGIWANASHEVIYFVTTRDADGKPLTGASTYVIDFPAADHPDGVVNAYWSLSLVDIPGFLAVSNPLNRYTFNMVAPPPSEADGSMRIYLAPAGTPGLPPANLLPSPKNKPFSLTFRTYVPKEAVKRGEWFPPAIHKLD